MIANAFKIVIFLFFFNIYIIPETFAKLNKFYHSEDKISNYFLGSILFDARKPDDAIIYFDKINDNMTDYSLFNQKYVNTLVNLRKFNKAFSHLKKIDNKKLNLYEFNLLLGVQAFKNKNYNLAKKYFKKIGKEKNYTDLLQMNLDLFLLSWTFAGLNNEEMTYEMINYSSNELKTLQLIQKTLVDCAFNSKNKIKSFNSLIDNKSTTSDFSRYNFFLASTFLHEENVDFANKTLISAKEKNSDNLLINQTLEDLKNKKNSKIKNKYNCQNVNHNMAEFFYVVSNIYSSDEEYAKSNFYLNISQYLNPNFDSNKILLAENLMRLKQYDSAFKEYSHIV